VPITEQELELRQPVGTASDDEEEEAHEVEYNADSTFINSLKYGVDCLKKAYPNAEIVLLSPYYPLANNGGTTPFVEGGHTLTEYMKAIEETAKSEAVTFYDLYHKGTINKSNTSTYLEGGVHTNETGAFAVGEDIARFLGETE
ncbi:MAG: hypothetical protein J5626_03885, partial [Lachnospiraceae bacterium]|nr:hypothetical protein [Lachnospiraceae bacterium]